jgi:hypothetical protein
LAVACRLFHQFPTVGKDESLITIIEGGHAVDELSEYDLRQH